MQDVRALFDEKKYFLKIPIFDVANLRTQIFENSALFTDFRPLASFCNTVYRHLRIDFLETRAHGVIFEVMQ